jgi:hypothetical protein
MVIVEKNWWNEDCQGKLKYSENTCPNATLSTTYLTWLDPGLNSGRRGGKPATNRLSYGVAYGPGVNVTPVKIIPINQIQNPLLFVT